MEMHIDRQQSFKPNMEIMVNEINPSLAKDGKFAMSGATSKQTSPNSILSPSQKLVHLVGSPIRLVKR